MTLRATPDQNRKAHELTKGFAGAGIRFIPMPVIDDEDEARMVAEIDRKLEKMQESSE